MFPQNVRNRLWTLIELLTAISYKNFRTTFVNKLICVCIGIILLAGCASSGVKVTDSQARQFKTGVSTRNQVISILGQPTSSTRSSDGTITLQYVYAESTTRASSFIPFVGLFTGGADVKSNIASFKFNKDGILQETNTTESNYGVGLGGAADNISSDPANQPRQ